MSAGNCLLLLSQARLTDSNKNLVARALVIFGELAKAMGPAWERVGRPVLQQAVTFLADNKKQVRSQTLLRAEVKVSRKEAAVKRVHIVRCNSWALVCARCIEPSGPGG